jgi:hypothetical protein
MSNNIKFKLQVEPPPSAYYRILHIIGLYIYIYIYRKGLLLLYCNIYINYCTSPSIYKYQWLTNHLVKPPIILNHNKKNLIWIGLNTCLTNSCDCELKSIGKSNIISYI